MEPHHVDLLKSARIVIEGIAVAAILWIGSSVNEGNLAIARLQVQLTQVQLALADVPSIKTQLAQLEVRQEDTRQRVMELSAEVHQEGAKQ
jgi:hypothetical protein